MAKLGYLHRVIDYPAPPPENDNDAAPNWRAFYDAAVNAARTAQPGNRNVVLNASAFKAGRVVGGKFIDETRARADLMAAARMVGLETGRAASTITSGLRAGMVQPFEETPVSQGPKRPWERKRTPAPFTLVPTDEPSPAQAELEEEARQKTARANRTFEGGLPLEGTRGASYLANRGITIIDPNLRYSPNFNGIVVPLRTPQGELTSVQHIPVNPDLTRGEKRTHGPMKNAVYLIEATRDGGATIICDGPEDALSAHEATGWRCIASMGKNRIVHAADHLLDGTTVIIVRDRDGTSGDEYRAAEVRMRQRAMNVLFADPPEPFKDVNDLLKAGGNEAVRDWLQGVLEGLEPAAKAMEEDEQGAEEAPEAPPCALPEPSGLVRVVRDHVVKTALYPHPELALAAALVIVGAVMGRRYSFRGNIRPNLYVLGVAPSSSGKGHVLTSLERILVDSGFEHLLGGKEPASGSAVISRLVEEPVTVYAVDEFGMFLRAIINDRAPTHTKDIVKVWTELYTKSADRFADKDRADRKSAPTKVVHEPHLSIYSTAAETHVWKALTPDNIADGSVARFMIVEASNRFPDPAFDHMRVPTPQTIRDQLRLVFDQGGGARNGNLDAQTSRLPDPPILRELAADAEAEAMIRAAILAEVEAKRKNYARGLSGIYGRHVELSLKLAMIHAVGRDPQLATVEAIDMEWALSTARVLIDRVVENIVGKVARNDHERASLEILAMIRAAGGKGMMQSDIIRKTKNMKAHERNDILCALVDAGDIAATERKAANGRTTTYWTAVGGRRLRKTDS